MQAFTNKEGSRASRLIHERADMLDMALPSETTRRLALVSLPARNNYYVKFKQAFFFFLKPNSRDILPSWDLPLVTS